MSCLSLVARHTLKLMALMRPYCDIFQDKWHVEHNAYALLAETGSEGLATGIMHLLVRV
jgi:hypothetical protein